MVGKVDGKEIFVLVLVRSTVEPRLLATTLDDALFLKGGRVQELSLARSLQCRQLSVCVLLTWRLATTCFVDFG